MAEFHIYHSTRDRHGDHTTERPARRARRSDYPVHRRRRHRTRHLARQRPRARCRRRESVSRKTEDRLDGSVCRREKLQAVRQLAARRHGRSLPRVLRGHQGTADDADRRRLPLAERRAASAPRSVCVPAPGSLVQGRPFAGQTPGKGGHGGLPREHRRHLCRHRVSRRNARGSEDPGFLREGVSEGLRGHPVRHEGGGRRRGRRSSRRSARRTATSASKSALD